MAPSRHEVGKADLDSHWSRSTVGRFKPARKSPRARGIECSRAPHGFAESLMGRRRYAPYAGDDNADIVLAAHLQARMDCRII
jgi:hypothetical protein